MRRASLLVCLVIIGACRDQASPGRGPIIDVHLHSTVIPPGADRSWFPGWLEPASSNEALRQGTLRAMREHNVVLGVVNDYPSLLPFAQKYRTDDPGRFMVGLQWGDTPDPLDAVPGWLADRSVQVLGEITTQYAGRSPNDPVLEPVWRMAEQFDVPVGIHVGPSAPGGAWGDSPQYRASLSNALLLEEVLVRHPRLRLYVMHAGWPGADEMVALLHAFPSVYVDIGFIDWYIPRAEFHSYLERLVDAGFGKRIMFGSDQIQWPGAIGAAVAAVDAAAFLSADQRRDIYCNNAARFLKLAPDVCKSRE